MKNNTSKIFSIDKIIDEKKIYFYKKLPNFIQNIIKSLLHEKEVNELLFLYKDEPLEQFFNKIIDHFQISINLDCKYKLDQNKRYIFVCNHPTGILDGIVVLKTLSNNFDCRIIANDIISNLHNLDKILLPTDWIGSMSKKQALKIIETLESDKQLILFPAGEVSKITSFRIQDNKWNNFFIKKAKQYNRDIVPIYISGHNSIWFYLIYIIRYTFKIKFNLEMFLLIHELFNKKKHEINLKFGNPISFQSLKNKNLNEECNKIQKAIYYL